MTNQHKLVTSLPNNEHLDLVELAELKQCSVRALIRGMIQASKDPDVFNRITPVRSRLGRPIKEDNLVEA